VSAMNANNHKARARLRQMTLAAAWRTGVIEGVKAMTIPGDPYLGSGISLCDTEVRSDEAQSDPPARICPECGGSGEGRTEGSRCIRCNGLGEQ